MKGLQVVVAAWLSKTWQNPYGKAAILLLIFALDVFLVYSLQTSRRISAGDLFIPWFAAHEMIINGQEPYSQLVNDATQIAITGGLLGPEVPDPLSYNYPLYMTMYLVPLIWLDYAFAEAIWNVINQFAMCAATLAIVRLVGWQPQHPLLKLLPFLAAFLCYPFLYTIAYGQYAILALFFLTTGFLLLQEQKYWLGGAVTVLGMLKPQTGLLLVTILMLWCLLTWRERWQAVVSGAVTGLLLLILPMYWYPDWPVLWLNRANSTRTRIGWYISYGEQIFYTLGLNYTTAIIANAIIGLLLGLTLVWLWWHFRHSTKRLPELFGLTGLVTLVILAQHGFCNDIIYYPAAALGLCYLSRRLSQRSLIFVVLGSAIGLYIPLLVNPNIIRVGVVLIVLVWLSVLVRQSFSAKKPAVSYSA